MRLLAIDPGSDESAWVLYDTHKKEIIEKRKSRNEELREQLAAKVNQPMSHIAIEFPVPRGEKMYTQLLDTVFWTGRFIEAWGQSWDRVNRQALKLHLCGKNNAKDSNIRAALINRYSRHENLGGGTTPEIGTKKKPGPLYGFSRDTWAALAIALYWAEAVNKSEDFLG